MTQNSSLSVAHRSEDADPSGMVMRNGLLFESGEKRVVRSFVASRTDREAPS